MHGWYGYESICSITCHVLLALLVDQQILISLGDLSVLLVAVRPLIAHQTCFFIGPRYHSTSHTNHYHHLKNHNSQLYSRSSSYSSSQWYLQRWSQLKIMIIIIPRRIHVSYIYLHLVNVGKYTWILWVPTTTTSIIIINHPFPNLTAIGAIFWQLEEPHGIVVPSNPGPLAISRMAFLNMKKIKTCSFVASSRKWVCTLDHLLQ